MYRLDVNQSDLIIWTCWCFKVLVKMRLLDYVSNNDWRIRQPIQIHGNILHFRLHLLTTYLLRMYCKVLPNYSASKSACDGLNTSNENVDLEI